MSFLLKTTNNLTVNALKTFLSNPEVAGTGVLRWKNFTGFSPSWAIQIGETGEEQSEIVILGTATPSGTAGTLTGTTLFEHPADTPIYAIKYNQIVFERSTSGTAGTATPIAGGTINIDPSQSFTQYDDTLSSSGYAYKTYFYNSVLAVQSAESDWITDTGYTFYSLASIRQRIKDKLWNSSFLPDDKVIDNWINEWRDKMVNAAIAVNEEYSMGSVQVQFKSDGLGTITIPDFKQARRVWITYDGQNAFQSTKMSPNDYIPTQIFTDTHPYHFWFGNNIFAVKPEENGGTATILFYRSGTPMVNETDELPMTMVAYTDSFVDFGVAQALFKDGKTAEYQIKMAEVNAAKQMFLMEMSPRDKSGPTNIDLVETTSGEDGWSPI